MAQSSPATPMAGRICLITGASSGIGKETAIALAELGAFVIMHGRDPKRSASALQDVRRRTRSDDIDLLLADLSEQQAVRDLAAEVMDRYSALHVLVNNAGALRTRREVTADGLEYTFALNHMAYFRLTLELSDMIQRSGNARIINVSSSAHFGRTLDFDDLQAVRDFSPMGAYGRSKLANVLFTYELARRLRGSRVTANCLHPGLVRTRFGTGNSGLAGALAWLGTRLAKPFMRSGRRGAETSVYLASSPEVEGVSGRFFIDCEDVPSSAASYDEEAARRLWAISEDIAAASSGPAE